MKTDIDLLAEAIQNAERICVFTGAGISCPSGIPDFRSEGGLYRVGDHEGYPPEEILSHTFFVRRPDLFYDFYRKKMLYPDALPNPAHTFFAELEASGKDVSVVTQNIDGLHQAAGSRTVYELHGSVHRNTCPRCGRQFSLAELLSLDTIPYCPQDGGLIKPDVVLYEEPLDEDVVGGAIEAIENADLMIIVGSSLRVYPAASYVRYFHGKTLALINKAPTAFDSLATIAIYDDVVSVVKKLKERL